MSNNDLIRSSQVNPLPIGPGGNNEIKQKLNSLNVSLTMAEGQATADTRFDPPPPEPITKPSIKEAFCTTSSISVIIGSIGILCIVYGIVTK